MHNFPVQQLPHSLPETQPIEFLHKLYGVAARLDGLSPKAMLQFLEENENVKEIYLCLDSDAAGIEACGKLKDLLLERGYTEEQVWQLSPAYKGSDKNNVIVFSFLIEQVCIYKGFYHIAR